MYIRTKVKHLTRENVGTLLSKCIEELEIYQVYRRLSTIPCCFDTETTTSEKHSYIYMSQLKFGKYIILCRNYKLMVEFMTYLAVVSENNFLMGIANMSYEMAFLLGEFTKCRAYQKDPTMLIPESHKPLTVTVGKMKFVDICRIANASLATIGKNYTKHQKKEGDLDYKKIRNSKTPMTLSEYRYCINDVVVGAEYMSYLFEEFTKKGKKFPLTSTAVLRNMMNEKSKDEIYDDVKESVKKSFPSRRTEYLRLMNYLFRGGFTHANAFYVGDIMENVTCADYTSDYPSIMMQEKFGTVFTETLMIGDKILNANNLQSEEGLRALLTMENDIAFFCEATFKFINHTTYHSVESKNKTIDNRNFVEDNGRLVRADSITVLLTEQDFHIYTRYYEWKSMTVKGLKMAIKKPLPKYVIDVIKDKYILKATLKKAKKDDTPEYAMSKGILNAAFGATVQQLNTDSYKAIINDDRSFEYKYIPYDATIIEKPYKIDKETEEISEKWYTKIYVDYFLGLIGKDKTDSTLRAVAVELAVRLNEDELEEELEKYRPYIIEALQQASYKKAMRDKILSPFWGIWVTAYARRRLLDMVLDVDNKAIELTGEPAVLYCDTDSMYVRHIDKYMNLISEWNVHCLEMNKSLGDDFLNDLGQFEIDPPCSRFKTLGAKRYVKEYFDPKKNKIVFKSTIAGLPKNAFAEKCIREGKDPFNFFNSGMILSEWESDKLTTSYTQECYGEWITDEYGNTEYMEHSSGVALVEIPFEMKIIATWIEYINKEVRVK